MKGINTYVVTTLLILQLFLPGCHSQNPEQASVPLNSDDKIPFTTNVEFQSRGNGIAETVTDPVCEGTYTVKLEIPENYTMGDAARCSVPMDKITLNEITTVSYRCLIDERTPLNPDGTYWVPYITFEIDTDGMPGCDTWVIGGKGNVIQESGTWFELSLEEDWLFHVPTTVADYNSPFPITSMGMIPQIRSAIGPDGETFLGDYPVTGIRLAIGNWGPGGPTGPVVCYVDDLVCNGNILFK